MEDYYTIQTPEHHSSLFTQLHSLQKQGVMCDVILAAEDGEVMAHKVILMAVSKYFRDKLSPVISSTPTRVFLKGIPVIELANLVKYIYTGKLLIAKETMDITLEVAEILQLNGVVNGYKEILAYEHLKVPTGEGGDASDAKPNKQSAEYGAFNVQVEQFSEEPVKEGQTYVADTDQAVMQNGYQQVENDGAVHVASTETVTTGTSSALNTSTEYAFETNLFEDQYYDVNVGSAIGVQSDSQVTTMPSLQKMATTMSEGIQSQHQDLLSVAIETLTDANYLSSPPGKDPRQSYSTVASQGVSYGSSVSSVDTSSQLHDPLATGTYMSNPTPIHMVRNSSTAGGIKPTHAGPKPATPQETANGHIPVYRVSLPSTVSLRQGDPKGRPKHSNDLFPEKRGVGRPRVKQGENSPPERASKQGKLIVSTQLTNTRSRAKEAIENYSEIKKCLKKKPEEPKKTDPHLNKVVEDLKSKVSETRAAKKKAKELKETETETVQTEAADMTNDGGQSAESSAAVVASTENNEDFGQSVNFDSDDDDDDDDYDEESLEQDSDLHENIEKIVDSLSTNEAEVVTDSGNKKQGNKKKAAAKVKVLSYLDVAKKASDNVERKLIPETPRQLRSQDQKENDEKSSSEISEKSEPKSGKGEAAQLSRDTTERDIETQDKSDDGKVESVNQKAGERTSEAPLEGQIEEKTEGQVNDHSQEKTDATNLNEGKVETTIDQLVEEKKRPKINTNEIMTRRRQSLALKESVAVENDRTPEKVKCNEDTKHETTNDLEIFKTPKQSIENKEADAMDDGIGSSSKDDLRSSASKRKAKAPRRLTDNTKVKTSLNKDVPVVRTRRSSKNDPNVSATNIKIQEDMTKDGNKKIKEIEKEKIDLAIPIAGKEAKKTERPNLQPVVKLVKQSTETIMSMAREIAASSSPKKRKLDKIQVEIQQTDASESVKKKTKRPTEPQPVSALKNRQKDDESDDDEDDDVEEINLESGSEEEDFIEVEIKDIEEVINNDGNDKATSKEKDSSRDGAPEIVSDTPKRPQANIKCTKCNKVFRYRMQLNKHEQTCKLTKSAFNRDRNIFADFQGEAADPEAMAREKRGKSGTPESSASVTLEIIQFCSKDGKMLKNLVESGTEKNKLYVCQEQDCKFSNESLAKAITHLDTHRRKRVCNSCGMYLYSEARFIDHECGLLCGTCNIVFETKTDIANHLDEQHAVKDEDASDSKIVVVKEEENGEIKKEADGATPVSKLKRKPKKAKSTNTGWTCVLCTEILPTREELLAHENTHDLTCSCCNKTWPTGRRYKFHIVNQKRKSSDLLCFICNKSFSRRTDQRKHMFKFHGSPAVSQDGKQLPVFECDICSFVAWSQRLLNLHKKAHTGVRDEPCPQCDKMFLSKYDVNRHLKTVHGPMRSRFKCGVEGCNFSTAALKTLKTHLQLKHTDEKTFIRCPFCDYKAALKGNLDKHLRMIHKLDIVSKTTLKNRQKYGDMKHGTIITKDGREVTEDDIEKFNRPCRGSKERIKAKLKLEEVSGERKRRRRRPKTIEEFTQELMAKHMKRLETPVIEKDYRCNTIDTALKQPAFPQASVVVRREQLAAKGIGHPRGMVLQYDKMDEDEALQYTVEEDYDDISKEVIVDDGIVPLPSTGMSVGNEVYLIEAGKSENIIESEFTQPFVDNEYEDETTRSLRVLTTAAENEDETSRSLRVLTTLLEAGQHG